MQEKIVTFKSRGKTKSILLKKEVIALKLIRINKKITREEAAKAVGVVKATIERFENGRTNFTEVKIKKLLRRYKVSHEEFRKIVNGEIILPNLPARSVYNIDKKEATLRRKYKKIISKEVRIIKVFRRMDGLTKAQAAKLCNYHRSTIDHLENGRVNLTKDRIKHIVRSYGRSMDEFNEFMSQELLRDEVIEECNKILESIDQEKLTAVRALLINFK